VTDTLSSTTTAEEDRKTFGQRRINLIWEVTQAGIAVMVSGAAITAALRGQVSEMLGNAFFLVIGFYFGRTNHQRVGGIGARNDDAR
jgi:hypothetical protein